MKFPPQYEWMSWIHHINAIRWLSSLPSYLCSGSEQYSNAFSTEITCRFISWAIFLFLYTHINMFEWAFHFIFPFQSNRSQFCVYVCSVFASNLPRTLNEIIGQCAMHSFVHHHRGVHNICLMTMITWTTANQKKKTPHKLNIHQQRENN